MNRDIISECIKNQVYEKEKRDELIRILEYFKERVPQEDIEYYNNISPILLHELDRREDKDEIYKEFYNQIICVVIKSIKSKKYNMAYYYLKAEILELQDRLLTKEHNAKLLKSLKTFNFID